MSTFRAFEEIEVWQKARELTREIYALTEKGSFSRDFSLKDQIRRACISVMSNIAEGHDRGGTREFVQFLSIAKGSIAEVKSQLYVAMDCGYIERSDFSKLLAEGNEIGRMIGGLMKYLRKSKLRGSKFLVDD